MRMCVWVCACACVPVCLCVPVCACVPVRAAVCAAVCVCAGVRAGCVLGGRDGGVYGVRAGRVLGGTGGGVHGVRAGRVLGGRAAEGTRYAYGLCVVCCGGRGVCVCVMRVARVVMCTLMVAITMR